MNGFDQFLGIVQNGMFYPLEKDTLLERLRLTEIQRQEARSPESCELNLTKYESSVIMVQGYHAGGWIYSASVIDHAGPILTATVRKLFVQSK